MKMSEVASFDSTENSVFEFPYSCYCSKNNTTFISWTDKFSLNETNPWYAIYDWNTLSFSQGPTKISETIYVIQQVTCCYIYENDEVITTWSEDGSGDIYYAIFSCKLNEFVAGPTKIPSQPKADNNIFSCYNSKENQVIFSWTDGNSGHPFFAVYDCTTYSFLIDAEAIGSSYTGQAYNNVFCSYNSKDNTVLFSWKEDSSKSLYYSLYDFSTQSFLINPTEIADGNFEGYQNLYSCYNSKENTFILTWSSDSYKPFYAVLEGNAESFRVPPTQIRSDVYFSDVSDIFVSYDPALNTALLSWCQFGFQTPYFAVYHFGSNLFPNPPSQITDIYGLETVTSSYNSQTRSFFVTWLNDDNNSGFYSLYYDENYWIMRELQRASSAFYQK